MIQGHRPKQTEILAGGRNPPPSHHQAVAAGRQKIGSEVEMRNVLIQSQRTGVALPKAREVKKYKKISGSLMFLSH